MDVIRRVDLSSLAVHREEVIQAEAIRVAEVRSAAEAGGVGSKRASQRSYSWIASFAHSHKRVFLPLNPKNNAS